MTEQFKAVWSRLAFPLAFTSLVVAFVIGQIAAQPDFKALLQQQLPGSTLTLLTEAEGGQIVFRDETAEKEDPENKDDPPKKGDTAKKDDAAKNEDAAKEDGPAENVDITGNYVIISEAEGYGGPLVIGIRASGEGKITEILSLQNKETLSFFDKMVKKRFFEQFPGKTVSDNFLLDDDIDAVSGATVSSRAFTEAVRGAMHIAATEHFKLTPTWKKTEWQFGPNELGLIGIFALAFLVSYAKGTLAKYGRLLMPVVSLAFVGVYTNSSVSIGQIAGIVMGYVPDFKQNMLWWIMMAGMIGGVLVLGRNIYCAQVCPFQYIQRGLNKVSGVNLAVRPGVQKSARMVVGWMTWAALMLIFLSAHPTLGSYEPFAMMFSFTGAGVQWYILPLSLVGSFFVLNFWCRLFCPVGLTLNEMVRLRRSLIGRIKPRAAPAGKSEKAVPEDKGDLWRNES